MSPKKTAIIAGASGLIGNHLLKLLLSDGNYDNIISISRRNVGISHQKLTEVILDLDSLTAQSAALTGDAVFCCLGTTIKKAGNETEFRKVDHDYVLNLAQNARSHGVKKFILVSAMGANSNSKIFYSRVKGEIENAVRELAFPSTIILRPSLLLGERKEFRLGEKIASILSPLFSPFLFGKLSKYRPIEAATVAKAMQKVAEQHSPGLQILTSERIRALGRDLVSQKS